MNQTLVSTIFLSVGLLLNAHQLYSQTTCIWIMSSKPSKKTVPTHPTHHGSSGKTGFVGGASTDLYLSFRVTPPFQSPSMTQKKALVETLRWTTKDQAQRVQPSQAIGTAHTPGSMSLEVTTQTTHPCSSNGTTGAALDRWQRETPQEQYWNSEGFYAKKGSRCPKKVNVG